MYILRSNIQGIVYQKKYIEKFVDYFPFSKNGMTEPVSTQKLFHTEVLHSKPPIEKIAFIILFY